MTDRDFLIGETVHLSLLVSKPGTKVPQDVNSVTVTSLKRGGATVNLTSPNTPTFTRVAEGSYENVIQTVGFAAGIYDVTVTAEDTPIKVVIAKDRFVLNSA